MSYLNDLGCAIAVGAEAGAVMAVISVIVDEVRGYRRMKRFAKAAQEQRRTIQGRGLN